MSKHHQYHPSQTGNLQSTKKSQLVDSNNHHGTSNGFRSTNSSINNQTFEHASQSNDTNNNYNKHRGHKRSSAEPNNSNANSSKKSKLSVPSDKSGKCEGDDDKLSPQNHYNIMEKLKELYKELKNDKSCKELNLSPSSFLLDKLVTRERLHTLVINLYPGNKGYSLAFRPATSTPTSSMSSSNHRHHTSPIIGEIETPSWLYDNAHLLDALDSEELPPLIIDFCNIHCPHLYYNGAVIAQIRDYRQSYPLDICDIHYVLLKPTATALWDEINGVVDSSWSAKERTAFESAIVLATSPPICLDPSPSIGIAAINATTESQPFAIEEVRRCARKFLQVTKNRNNKLEKKTHYQQTELASHLAIERRGNNHHQQSSSSRREIIRPLRAHRKRQCMLIDGIDMNPNMKFVDTIAPSRSYDWQPRNVERVTLKTDRDSTQYRVIVDLSQRATSCELVGELSLERQTTSKVIGQQSNNHNNSNNNNGSGGRKQMCPFKLSSPLAARRYVKEFIGIFTEEGRKCVEIVHEKEMKTGREVKQWMTGTGEKIQPLISTVPKPQTSSSSSLPTPSTSIINPNNPPQPQQQQQQQIQILQQQQPPPPPIPALKITAAPQRIITTAQMTQPKQLVVVAQVKQEPGNQVIKNLLNQPRAPLNFQHKQQPPTPTNIVATNGHSSVVPAVFLQVDQSNLIHMGSGGLQFQQLITTPVKPPMATQQTIVKRNREM